MTNDLKFDFDKSPAQSSPAWEQISLSLHAKKTSLLQSNDFVAVKKNLSSENDIAKLANEPLEEIAKHPANAAELALIAAETLGLIYLICKAGILPKLMPKVLSKSGGIEAESALGKLSSSVGHLSENPTIAAKLQHNIWLDEQMPSSRARMVELINTGRPIPPIHAEAMPNLQPPTVRKAFSQAEMEAELERARARLQQLRGDLPSPSAAEPHALTEFEEFIFARPDPLETYVPRYWTRQTRKLK